MVQPTKTLRIFVGSPGDVAKARDRAFDIIKRLSWDPLLPDGYAVEAIGWDRTPYATPAWLCPQKAIDQGLPRPSACDIALFILWCRIGTRWGKQTIPRQVDRRG